MLRVDFHSHTIHSKDSLSRPADLLAACRRKRVDRLVITDHNQIDGALQAQRLDPERFIVGEEIMTSEGELLAAFVQECVPAGLSPRETIARLRQQGAFISVSHPFDRQRNGAWRLPALQEIVSLVDAIETFNARCMVKEYNDEARAFAQRNNLPGTAGSDAHAVFEVGSAVLVLPDFHDAPSLQQAVRLGQVEGRLSSPLVHLASVYARLRKNSARVSGENQ